MITHSVNQCDETSSTGINMRRPHIYTPVHKNNNIWESDTNVGSNHSRSGSIYGNSRSSHSDNSGNYSKKKYTIRELTCNLRDAVVTISGQTVVTAEDKQQYISTKTGNGFFIKGHYIICPADIILINPIINKHTMVSKILIDVSNVNGSGLSYSYNADIVGIDGAGNIAVLRINPSNQCNPPIRVCHPFLQWGKSRGSCPGDTILVIGGITSPVNIEEFGHGSILSPEHIMTYPIAENAVAIGNISDNRYVFPTGQVPGELLLLSNIFSNGSQRGVPVIDVDGTVIGMSLFINSPVGYNVALSEFFMRRPVKAIIRSYQDKGVPEHYRGFVEQVPDPINSYYKFNKSWLGITGFLMGQEDFNTNIHPDKLMRIPTLKDEILIDDPICKEIVGYRILTILTVSKIQSSPMHGILLRGDIITHINNCPLGDRKGQISPSLIMWRVRPGDVVTIKYKKQSERFQDVHEISIPTCSYQPFFDYPFYGSDRTTNILQTLI